MTADEIRKALIDENYPLAAKYDPDWIFENKMGDQCLWNLESLCRKMKFKPGMRVLDMGCGKAISSIFLAKEFGVQVFANDLWIEPTENWKRICEAGVSGLVYPIKAEAHSLPYAEGFFDAVVCINSYQFYGTADTYLEGYLAKLVRPGGQIGIVVPGMYEEYGYRVPEYLKELWEPDMYYYHCPDWWKWMFERTGLFECLFVDDMDGDGNRLMKNWECIMQRVNLLRTEHGKHFAWLRIVANRKA
jgi:cyclopropane fatty-acyl-phospholipid synthase-like methyltransferase